VLRFDAKPEECYADGRVQKIMEAIEQVGQNLKNYEDKKWQQLRKKGVEIFKDTEKDLKLKLEEMGEK
jgi:hypothetical protein